VNRKADTMTDGQLLIDGEWVPSTGGRVEEIRSPYDGRVVGQAAVADLSDADKALASSTSTGPRCGGPTSCRTAA
jgi:acyl-CoA reductase-like NAD-dependent aldehyde dehydrogenase